MEEILVEELLKAFIEAVKNGDYNVIIPAIITIVSILLYRQFFTSYKEKKKSERESLWLYIQKYSEALFYLDESNGDENDDSKVKKALYNLLPYTSNSIRQLIVGFDPNNKEKLKTEIEINYVHLKGRHKSDVSRTTSDSTEDTLSYYYHRTGIDEVFIPILYTVITVTIMLFITFLLFIYNDATTYQKFITTLFFAVLGSHLASFPTLVDLVFSKRIRKEPIPIVMTVIYFIAFGFWSITFYSIGLYLYLLYVIFYIVFGLKKSLVESNN